MSSILKALKKVEENSPPPQPHALLSRSSASEQMRNTQSGKRRRKLLYLFLVLLGMTVVAVVLFNQRKPIMAKVMSMVSSESPPPGPASEPNQTPIYRAKVPSAAPKPARKPPAATRRAKTQTQKVVPDSRNKKFQASSQSSKRRSSRAVSSSQTATSTRKPDPSRLAKVKKPLKQDTPPPALAAAKPPGQNAVALKDTRSTPPPVSAKKPAKTRTRKTYDRIADAKLKLQALAWSDDAVRRMAVINGRIVHEGESVDGYQVEQIREEDVIVNAGGKSWRLEFGLRQ